jgi:hypothetical protein
MARRFELRPPRPFAERFTVCAVNRKLGVVPGSSIGNLAGHYAEALGHEFSEPGAALGMSTGAFAAADLASIRGPGILVGVVEGGAGVWHNAVVYP